MDPIARSETLYPNGLVSGGMVSLFYRFLVLFIQKIKHSRCPPQTSRCPSGDFLSLAQLGLPVKVVVVNNGSLGFVAMEMKAAGYLDNGTDLKNPSFAAMAEAIGIKAFRVEESGDLPDALREAFSRSGPVLVDVVTAKQELVMPPKIQVEQAKGFSLYMLKAIISGRGDAVVDLARTNLLR